MSEHNSENFEGIGKKCLIVFCAVMGLTLVMVGIHQAHLPNQALAIGLTLAAAAVNATLVACYLMHILTEKKMTYITFAFTAIFFIGLMVLSLSARLSVPHGTVH